MAVSVVPKGFSNVRLKRESGTVSAFARIQGGDNFVLDAQREDIRNYARHGDDLIIEFIDGQRLTIKDFFSAGRDYHNLILESAQVQHFVDFAQALRVEEGGDGIDEALIRHQPVYAQEQAHVPNMQTAQQGNIDYDNIVSSVQAGDKKSGFSSFFSGKNFATVLGGLGALGAVVEYAYGDEGSHHVPAASIDVPIPEPLIPPPPIDNDIVAGDLHFFTPGAYLVETRIVKLDPASDNSFVPIFSTPLFFDEQSDMSGENALPLLYHMLSDDPSRNVFAKISGSLAPGEKVQFRANSGNWQDGEYSTQIEGWYFKHQMSEGELYRVDSRIVNADGVEVRQGASISPDVLYEKLSNWMKDNMPAIARIDYMQEGEPLYNPVYDAHDIIIGGQVMGKFGEDYKIQIRLGGGWYDATTHLNEDGSYSWHYNELPTLVSRGTNDDIILEDNVRDTLFYQLLDSNDATGGNGSDRISNFKIGQWGQADADRIDIASLLIGYHPTVGLYENGGLSHYLSVISDGRGNTEIRLDRDGLGDKFQETSLLFTLVGVQTSLEELYGNGQLIVS